MTPTASLARPATASTTKRYRLPGIEREGIAQLSLLETALWPLQGGELPGNSFQTEYTFPNAKGRATASVTVRAGMGLETIDEFVLGLRRSRSRRRGAAFRDPYWMLKHLDSKPAARSMPSFASRSCVSPSRATKTPRSITPRRRARVRRVQFPGSWVPTVGEERRSTTIAAGRSGERTLLPVLQRDRRNLLFDLDSTARWRRRARRLFLKLKDRFWRSSACS